MRGTSILVFDSGLGGLTVFREIVRVRPDAQYLYVGDDAVFPYGTVPEDALIARVDGLMGELIAAHAPDLVVIACNTASTIVLPRLRARLEYLVIDGCSRTRPPNRTRWSRCRVERRCIAGLPSRPWPTRSG